MLELSNFQIFMMVLHGCFLLFAFAFLLNGNTQKKSNKIISYREFQRQKNRRQKRKAVVKQNPSYSMRDVSEVSEMAVGADCQPPQLVTKTPLLSTSTDSK